LFEKIITKVAEWRIRLLPDKVFLFIVAIIIGLLSGLVAVMLKSSVHGMQDLLISFFDRRDLSRGMIFFPVAGLLLSTLFVQLFRKGELSRGIGNVLIEISKKKGIIASHKLYSQLVSSFFTLGFGGSAGLEAPISVTGAAMGSRIAQLFRIEERERKLLLACGAAGGIAGIFNSPIAGVLFAMEIIISDLSIPNFVPLLVATAASTLVSKVLYSGAPFKLITENWEISSLPYYIVLGIICAFVSVYMIRIYYLIHKKYSKWNQPYLKALTGGLALGVLLFIFPPLFGEGFNFVQYLLNGEYLLLVQGSIFNFSNIWILLIYFVLIIGLKVIATSITVNAGGNGGMFGSSLFTGALLGFVFVRGINESGFAEMTEVNFIVVAMAGILAGVIHAPLTAIFLIAEITGGYALFIPLMIVVALSYFISRFFEPFSAYTKGIAEKGEFILYDRDKLILENIMLSKMIEKDFVPLDKEDTLGKLIDAIMQSKRNIFPVIDKEEKLVGIVHLDDIRELMFDKHLYFLVLVKDVMTKPPAVVDVKERMYDIVKKVDDLNVWNLPVVKEGKYLGFISKSSILSHYRELLIHETRR
jgi:chloride channel protein, CIC family